MKNKKILIFLFCILLICLVVLLFLFKGPGVTGPVRVSGDTRPGIVDEGEGNKWWLYNSGDRPSVSGETPNTSGDSGETSTLPEGVYEILVKDATINDDQLKVVNAIVTEEKSDDFAVIFKDDNKMVFNLYADRFIAYYYKDEQLTGMEYYWGYESEEEAKREAEIFNTTPGISRKHVHSVVSEGRFLIITYTPEQYADKTYSSVLNMYDYFSRKDNQ